MLLAIVHQHPGRLETLDGPDRIAVSDVVFVVLVAFQIGNEQHFQTVGDGNLTQILIRFLLGQVTQMQVCVARHEPLLLGTEDERELDSDLVGRLLAQIDFLSGQAVSRPDSASSRRAARGSVVLDAVRRYDVPTTDGIFLVQAA